MSMGSARAPVNARTRGASGAARELHMKVTSDSGWGSPSNVCWRSSKRLWRRIQERGRRNRIFCCCCAEGESDMRCIRCSLQRPTQPPTGGGLSWWLLPLRGGRGRGLRRFAVVMAEVFAPSWWSRRRSFLHRHKNNAKKRFTCDFRLFYHRDLLGVCASSRHLRRQAKFLAKS